MAKKLLSRVRWYHIWLGATTALLVTLALVAGVRLSQPPNLEWETQPYGPLRAIVWAIAAASGDSQTLYVGVYGNGVYKSFDGGKTWQEKNAGLEPPELPPGAANYALNIQDISISRARPQTLHVATWGGDGIYRSDDGGENWRRQIINVWDTGDFDLEGSSLVRTLLETEDALFAGTASGVFSLTEPYTGDWYPTSLKGRDLEISALLAHPTAPRTLYAATLGQGIYKSTDGGQTWTSKTVSQERSAAQKVNALAFDPDDANIMVAGTFGDGVYRSVDAGEHWEMWTEGLPPQAEVWSLGYAPDGTLFVGLRQGGNYIRTGTAPWQKLAAFPYGALALEMDRATGTVYVGTWGGGVHRSNVATKLQDWQSLNGPLERLRLTAAVYGGDRLYVGTDSDGVYASSDQGVTWERPGKGLMGAALGVKSLAISPGGATLYLGTGAGVFMKPVDAATWVSVSNPITDNFSVIALSVTQNAQGKDEIYVGTETQGIWRYDAGAEIWTGPQAFMYRTEKKSEAYVPSILAEDEQVYASVWGSGVHKSTPSDKPWGTLQFSPKYVEKVTLAKKAWFQGGGRHFYAQTEQGLYGSPDGETWSLLYPNLIDAMTSDPHHPQVIYASLTTKFDEVQSAPMTETVTALPAQTTTPITTTAMFIGLGDGSDLHFITTTLPHEAGSVIQLLRDPQDKSRIVALMANGGLYRGQVTLPWLGREVAVGGSLVVLAYFILVLVPYSYLALVETYALKHRAAAELLWRLPVLLRLRRPRFQNRLQTLEKLILALVSEPHFELTDVWERLDMAGIIASRPLLAAALDRLVAYRILSERDGAYTYVARGIPQVAAVEFAHQVTELSEDARRENRLLTDVASFFEAAGFDTRQGDPQHLTGFVLRPRRALYRDHPQLYARLKTREPLTGGEVHASCTEICEKVGKTQPMTPIVFFVVDAMPEVAAFRQMRLASERIQVAPLSVAAIRRAQRDHAEQRDVDWLVQHPRVHADLFDIRTPVIDPLDFFGQAHLLKSLEVEINRAPQISLWGLPHSGKTSLLWALKESLVTPLVAYVDLTHRWQGEDAFHEQIIAGLTQDLWAKYNRFPKTPIADFEQTLLAFVETIPARDASDRRVVLMLDGVAPDTRNESGVAVARLQALAQRSTGVTVVLVQQSAAAPPLPWFPLGPLTEEASARLLETLGARMGLGLDQVGVDEIVRRTGGHPMLLRQLGSLVAQSASNLPAEDASVWIAEALPEYEHISERYFNALWRWTPLEIRHIILEWLKSGASDHDTPALPGTWGQLWPAQEPFGALLSAWVRHSLEENRL